MAAVSPEDSTAESLIKSRERVRDLAEVYTPAKEVNAMLDLVATEASSIHATFLEPACGNGNFLTAILDRKLATVTHTHTTQPTIDAHDAESQFEFLTLTALASIYGIDIDPQNVHEARTRMLNQLADHATRHHPNPTPDPTNPNGVPGTPGFRTAINTILTANITVGDTLNHPDLITIIEYEADHTTRSFKRTYHTLTTLTQPTTPHDDTPTLFDLTPTPQPAVTVKDFTHYSGIAA